MAPGIWIEATVSERMANLRREAAHERLIGLRRRSSWPGPESLTRRGDRS
jgi:hypothetical protein